MRKLLAVLAALLLALPAAAQERHSYTQAELDQMLAPIALYPDALLSQVLMASTYPLEVVEAARWSRARPGLKGDDAVRAAQGEDWDPSVKSLLAFPDLLTRMDEQLEWTRRLGDAFLEQEPHVMETVQRLRRKADAEGHLASDSRLRVADEGGTVIIEQADPQVVYVPYYDPLVVYGSWWWPAYPPVIWAAWPGYAVYRSGLWWGPGVTISAGFFFGGIVWSQRQVAVVRVSPYYVRLRPPVARRTVVVHRPIVVGRWQHDPGHRRGIGYRSPEVQRRFVPSAPARAPQRELLREPRREPGREPQREERRGRQRDDRRGNLMPPAFRASPQPQQIEPPRRAERPREIEAPQREAPRMIRPHARSRMDVDPAHRVGRVRPDAAQHRAAQPHRFARDARRDARQVPVRPAVRAGMAGDRPRMAR
jgi:hypothetical protein